MIFILGVSWLLFCLAGNTADNDLWLRLGHGAIFSETGVLPARDVFAFTPTTAPIIDHEWLSGFLFYKAAELSGDAGLLILKGLVAISIFLLMTALVRQRGVGKETKVFLLTVTLPVLAPAFLNTARCHIFSYLFFAVCLLFIARIKNGSKLWILGMLPLFTLWSNMHGGFAAGLGVLLFLALIGGKQRKLYAAAFVCAALGSLVNPYGADLWKFIFNILMSPNPHNTDWIKVPIAALDLFTPFRVLMLIAFFIIVRAWGRPDPKSSVPLYSVVLLVTALGLHQYRHGPFLAIAVCWGLAPGLQALFDAASAYRKTVSRCCIALSIALSVCFISQYSFGGPLFIKTPVNKYPVREADLLSYAAVKGNLAAPSYWGGYLAWRLHPDIKISMDGRNETAYPRETYDMDWTFFSVTGKNWNQLIKDYKVDFIVTDNRNTSLSAPLLAKYGYLPVMQSHYSSLYVSEEASGSLLNAAETLPKESPNPFDVSIVKKWDL